MNAPQLPHAPYRDEYDEQPSSVIFLSANGTVQFRRAPDNAELYEWNERERTALFYDNEVSDSVRRHYLSQRFQRAGYSLNPPKVRAKREPKAKREPVTIFR